MLKDYYVYILSNQSNRVVYIGVTNDLKRRLYEHKNELIPGFTKRYHVHKLVFYEHFSNINEAIAREKCLKGWKRNRKNALIQEENPSWRDISEDWETDEYIAPTAPQGVQ